MRPIRRLAVLSATAAIFASAPSLFAQTMEGDQILIMGFGTRSPISMNVLRGSDIGDPNIPSDFAADAHESSSLAISPQYFYQATPRWAFGVIAHYNPYNGTAYSLIKTNNVLIGQQIIVKANAHLVDYEIMPAAKYFFMDRQRINPYVLGGLGVNYLDSETSWTATYELPSGIVENGRSYRRSAGVAALLGGGVQAALTPRILAGVEARYEYLQTSSSAFGRSIWNSVSAALWIGTKWNSPL